jgi:hypothetical protein
MRCLIHPKVFYNKSIYAEGAGKGISDLPGEYSSVALAGE